MATVTKLTTKTTTAKDDKFVVFKREDLESILGDVFNHEVPDWVTEDLASVAVDDAVVIRTQDRFAGPALHAYATTMAQVAEALPQERGVPLLSVADYIADRAREADEIHMDGQSKFPD